MNDCSKPSCRSRSDTEHLLAHRGVPRGLDPGEDVEPRDDDRRDDLGEEPVDSRRVQKEEAPIDRLAKEVQRQDRAHLKALRELDAEGLQCRSVTVDVSGVGEASVYASESVDAEIAGIGRIDIAGSPSTVSKSQSSPLGRISVR